MATLSHRDCDTHWTADREVGHERKFRAGHIEMARARSNPLTKRDRERQSRRHLSAGIAAAFVTQVMHKTDDPSGWDEWAMRLMGVALAITIVVVLLPPGHHEGELTARSACCAWQSSAYCVLNGDGSSAGTNTCHLIEIQSTQS
jgi:hypothetical protein